MTDPDRPISPGPDAAPVASGLVLRLPTDPAPEKVGPEAVQRLQSGQALPEFFELSSADRAGTPPHLSVWHADQTTLQQAWVMVGARPDKRFVFYLPVHGVRALPGVSGVAGTLDVCWFAAAGPDGPPETRPGAAGHCGVTGLDAGSKTERKGIRSRLADLATRTGVRPLTAAEMTA